MSAIKKNILTFVLVMVGTTSMAKTTVSPFKLDNVSFNVSAKQWVKTQTAKVTVVINATLSNKNLVLMRQKIMKNLITIADGQWHIVSFMRQQDKSGLEKLTVTAEARVSQSALSNVNALAKKVSQPGAIYRIQHIDFSPSLEEVQIAKEALRVKLYKKVNDEIEALNKQFQEQKYSVHHLAIYTDDAAMMPMAAKRSNMVMAESAMPISVSNEIVMTARVTASSNRSEDD